MRIAQIAPLYEAVPPKFYGGTERVVANLCDALVELGHEVTLFAAADAQYRRQADPGARSARSAWIRRRSSPTWPRISRCCTKCGAAPGSSTSCISTSTCCTFPSSSIRRTRTVTTLHGRLDLTDLERRYGRWPQFGLVSISDHQRTPLPFVNWLATVPHGLPHRQLRVSRAAAAGLSRVHRPHLAGEAPRRRDLDRAPRRHPAEDRREGRCGRSRLLRDAHRTAPRPSVDRLHRRDRRRRRSRNFSVTRARCCSRSTGRSRSGW